jgi:hypothetical protein
MSNRYTNKNRRKKGRTEKSRNSKNLFKKIFHDDSSILDKNIKILIGGNEDTNTNTNEKPTKFDVMFLGYEEGIPIDTRGSFEKLREYVGDSFEKITTTTQGLISRKVLDTAGYENKTPEEVANELKNDTKKLEEINNYLQTKDGKEMINEIKELSNTATGVISESIEKIPETFEGSMKKMGNAGLKVGVGLATEVPIIAPIIGMSNMIKGTEEAIEATADAVKKVAEITGDTAEEIKKPINEIENKIDEISEKASNVDIKMPEVEIPEVEIPEVEIPEVEIPEVEIPEVEIPEVKMQKNNLEKQTSSVNEQLGGGSDINKFINLIQHGGKKIRKRVNSTRHAFKNISKNISKKQR